MGLFLVYAAAVLLFALALMSRVGRSWALPFALAVLTSCLAFRTPLWLAFWPILNRTVCIDEVSEKALSPSHTYTAELNRFHCALSAPDIWRVSVRRAWDRYSLLGSTVVAQTYDGPLEFHWKTNAELSVVIPEKDTAGHPRVAEATSSWAGLRLEFVYPHPRLEKTVVGSESSISLRTPLIDAILWLLFVGVATCAARLWFGLIVPWEAAQGRRRAVWIALPWLTIAIELVFMASSFAGVQLSIRATIATIAFGCAIFSLRLGIRESPRWALPASLRRSLRPSE